MPCRNEPGPGDTTTLTLTHHGGHCETEEHVDEQVAYYFGLLAGQVRMRMLRRLAVGPSSVSDLADDLSMSIALISHNLQRLHHAGLVQVRPQARKRVYRLDGRLAMSQDGRLRLRLPFSRHWTVDIEAPHFREPLGATQVCGEAVQRLLTAANDPEWPRSSGPRHRTGGSSSPSR
jgi:DNA-binding transcriptional ArsR family regulator